VLKRVQAIEVDAEALKGREEALKEKVEILEKSIEDDEPISKIDYESGAIKTVNGNVTLTLNEKVQQIALDDPALMHEDVRFLADLVYVILSAALFGTFAAALKIPIIVGFILGGMLVGPSGLALVNQMKRIATLAEVGASLILFVQGLEFDTSKANRFRSLSISHFIVQLFSGAAVATVLFQIHHSAFNFSQFVIIFVASSLCSSSVASHLANDYNINHGLFSNLLGASLFCQEFIMGLLLCLPDALKEGIWGPVIVLRQCLYAAFLVSAFIYLSWKAIPKLSSFLLIKEIPQLFLLTVFSMCLTGAYITSSLGLSAEFGAFFAGIALTKTSISKESGLGIESTRNLFSAILFTSVGMLISPSFVYNNLYAIVMLFMFTILIKVCASTILLKIFKQSLKSSVLVALCVSQIAEFSMILAGKGYLAGLLDRSTYLIFLTVSVVTLFCNPLLFKVAMSFKSLTDHNSVKIITLSSLKQVHSSIE
jgi:CPA2 family monovalent cation:H+ antiporter-2